jgi:hypothetical protein
MTPDFDKKLDVVQKRSTLYATALQTKAARIQQHVEILDWIWKSTTNEITPQRREDVGDTCHWFFETPEYLSWAGQGPSTLICSGNGIIPAADFLTYQLAGSGKSHLVLDPVEVSVSDMGLDPSFSIGCCKPLNLVFSTSSSIIPIVHEPQRV